MSLELSLVNPEDILNDVDNDGDWDLGWEFDREMLDLLGEEEVRPEEVEEEVEQQEAVEQLEEDKAGDMVEEYAEEGFDWSMLQELPPNEQGEEGEEEEEEQKPEQEQEQVNPLELELELHFEQQLAQLDGEPGAVKPPGPSVVKPMNWNLVRSLSSSASILVSRLCFARHLDSEYKIYEPFDGMGYHYLGMPLYLAKSELQQRQQLTEEYVHLFACSELPDHVQQSFLEESGVDVEGLLHNSDGSKWNIDGSIMCVARRERVDIVLKSTIGSCLEQHSGINVFGEPTQVSLTIHSTEIVLDNSMLVQLVKQPHLDLFLVANTNHIYILNGQVLLESTDLANYVLPLRNINLIVYSPRQFAV